MKLLLIALVIFVAGCATKTQQVSTQYDSQGRVISTTQNIDSKDYAEMVAVQSAESARAECYKSGAISPALDSHAQVAAIVAQAAGKGVNCGNGYNDTLIAKEQRKADQTATRWGFAGTALKTAAAVVIGDKVVDSVTTLGAAALGAAGNKITASDGSEINVNGNVGEGNTFTSSEEIGGIPLSEAEVEPIALGTSQSEDEISCEVERALLDSDPEGTDANGDGFVCSNGGGSVVDNG